MQKITTLTVLRKFFGKTVPFFVLLTTLIVSNVKAQYVNGNLGTGTVSKSGVAAPAGTQWHEMQNDVGNTTQSNVSIAFDASPVLGNSRVADNFVVPSTEIWNITKMNFYAVVLPPPPGTSPVTAVRVVIRNASPVGASTVIFGDLTTNRLSSTSFSNIYTIANSQVPAPGTVPNQNFVVWKVEANVPVSLTPGNYWIEWQLVGAAGQRVFALMSQPVGARTAAGYNAVSTFNGGPWIPTIDGGNPASAPDVPVDFCFGVNYTTSPCVSPTASVLSQVGYPTPPISIINETFTVAAPLPAGWAQQNLSTPAGTNPLWFQGNTGVFPGNTPPGYIACNFNSVGGANTISNWLLAPNITLRNGDSLTFFTRTTTGTFPDRLQVRRSQNGASTNVGASNTSVGDFTDLLLDINPTYTGTGYPTAWTKFTVIMAGLPGAGVSGRIAFRYFVEDGGPLGNNSDYIGLDDVVYRTPGGTVPPNTCTGSTANLKVDITGGIAPYTVVINTVPPTTPITVTNYQSGANIPITPAVTSQYTLTSVTGCGVGTGNSGTPTVIVSATPFPPLVIEALPDAPVCAGDPTLLTVKTGAPPTPITLYSQTGAVANGAPSQIFSDFPTFSSQSADDFTVPAGPNWVISRITTEGTGVGNPTSVNVVFHSNSGTNLPGAIISAQNNITTFVRTGGNYSVTLPSAVSLAPGTYWMSFVLNMPFGAGGQWFWANYPAPILGSEYAFQNPGGGFGTPCTSWGYGGSQCNVGGGPGNRNLKFGIIGTNTVINPLPAGYTFLWTPGAGLSNPTANPVGASPMITTTYTVLVTAPGGCQGTATKTVIVNQPPAVTTQPANAVICATGSASFSVVASGTGPLTYQWQEQVGGVGAWNNLANISPYSGTNTATLVINPVSGALTGNKYRCIVTGICNPSFTSNAASLTVNPLPVLPITPPGPICGGVAGINGVALTVGSSVPPVPGSVTTNSGSINIVIPDNNQAGISANLTVSGIPANATITGVKVNFNIPHTFTGDLVMALKAPNNDVLNLDYFLSGTFGGVTTAFTNTTVGSLGVATLGSGTDPFTGLFRADGQVTATANGPAAPTGLTVNRASYAALIANMTAANANGVYTLAIYDGGAIDTGTLDSWSITVDYTTPGVGTGATLSYVWSPTAGLFTDAGATVAYTGTNLATVYAAPSAYTVYTVTGTNTTTGCVNSNKVVVNYTPPAPNVTPNPVSMCLGEPAVLLKSSSSVTSVANFTSGPISVAIPEGVFPTRPATAASNVIAVTGIPANAVITGVAATLNATHGFANDIVAVLKSPSGAVINIDAIGGFANNAGADYLNTKFSSAGTTSIATGTAPFTGTWQADRAGVTFVAFGSTLSGGPVGFDPTTTSWATYMGTLGAGAANGNWTIAAYDAGAPDVGTLTKWDLQITYVVGTPATPAVWTPAAHLYSDAGATIPYIAGTQVDSVWVKPTPFGVYNYDVTVNSVPLPDAANATPVVIPLVGNGNPYPSVISVSNYAATGVSVKSVTLSGVTHTWGNDIDILLQSPTGQNVVLMSDVGGTVPVPNATYTFDDAGPAMSITAANASGTYKPTNSDVADNWPAPGPGAFAQAAPALSLFGSTANVNGDWKLFVVDDFAGDQGSITGGWSIKLTPSPFCTSPARRVVVTVRDTVKIITNPLSTSACITTGTNTRATFSVVATGDALTYQWETATLPTLAWTNIVNDANYSGATTATLTVNNPPVSWNGRLFRVKVTGSCGFKYAPDPILLAPVVLTVPSVTLSLASGSPAKLFPGLTTTLIATASPIPSPLTYEWYRNGALAATTTHPTNQLVVNVDGLGDYTVRTISGAGCANVSNVVTISDSASGKVFIYPNPNSGVFQVRYYASLNTRAPHGLNIYDAKGSRISINQYPNNAPYQRMDVDLRKYGKGVYWVEVIDVNGERLGVGRAVVL